uniref:Subtilisin-like protease n=1 Tax=Oryza nivara TaxID=4536 RepID=A0A0E0GXA3_ORYNI
MADASNGGRGHFRLVIVVLLALLLPLQRSYVVCQQTATKKIPEVLSIKPSIVHPLHTTRSQDFLGLDYTQSAGLLHRANYGDGVIIGIIDSGIWPESASFRDDSLGPLPSKENVFAGQAFGSNLCNRKIIGARWYDKHLNPEDFKGEYKSARDATGHGTHVSSTAAGALVPNISFHGLAAGYARGVAPRARLAMYKVCWEQVGCDEAAILQAIDDAIHDSVDVLSLSLGNPSSEPYGSIHAVKNGITVVFAAGNNGPAPRTVENSLPWVISVASATIDRAFPTVITLANNTSNFVGHSLFYEQDAKDNWYEIYQSGCSFQSVATANVTLAAGKIVLCYNPTTVSIITPAYTMPTAIKVLKEAEAKGIIFATYALDILDSLEDCGSMPCVLVDFDAAQQIKQSADQNTALVVKVTAARTWIGGEVLAPKISTFSSRGPSTLLSDFLKPDIAAPGSNILAAVQDSYKFMSGTSMACPHVSGVVALLKALHPDWSPAMIKSALVTTASNEKYGVPILADGLPQKIADPFDYGGGFIDPNRAVDPGLAYDVDPKDYTSILDCFSATNSSCEFEPINMNLPSIAIPNLKGPTAVLRTVTNVGQANAVYKAVVQSPPSVRILVEPSVLQFNQGKKKQSFKVTISMTHKFQGGYLFGSLAWCDGGSHYVRIPIAVRPVISDEAYNCIMFRLQRCTFLSAATANVTLAAGKIVLCYGPATVSIIAPSYTIPIAIKALKEAGAKGICS